MADADFRLDVGEGPALGPHFQHQFEFIRREGHAAGDLSLRQLLAVRCPARIGGDICLLRRGNLLALFPRHRGTTAGIAAPVVAAGGGVWGGLAHDPVPFVSEAARCFLPVGETGVCKRKGASQGPETQRN